jgi:hypothetical protein
MGKEVGYYIKISGQNNGLKVSIPANVVVSIYCFVIGWHVKLENGDRNYVGR